MNTMMKTTRLVLISVMWRGCWYHSLTLGTIGADGKTRVSIDAYTNLIGHIGATGDCVRWA